jgi:DNA invertase Pin-like site-specific DNA recombinase
MRLGYARKSTFDQQHALQIDALKADGCERIYVETASGLKTERPELRQLLDHARPGDVIVVYSLSRLARSIRHLLELGEDLRARDIGLKSLTEAIDTTTVSGRFMFNVLGALGQMEVELLKERTKAGLQAARARGRVGGRPKSLDPVKLTVVKTLLGEGTLTMAEIAEHVQVAPSTIYRAVKGGRSALA